MSANHGPSIAGVREAFHRLFFSPRDLRVCAAVRVAVALCLLVDLAMLGKDLTLWFSEGGVLPLEAAASVVDPDAKLLLRWFPVSAGGLGALYGLALLQAVLLLVGWHARVQAFCLFAWLTLLQYRNMLLVEGGDTLLRLLCFFLALMPCAAVASVDSWIARRRGRPLEAVQPAWALVLVQIEVTLIYLSTAWEKLNGDDWLSGHALYYVSRLDDTFGQNALVAALLDHLIACRVLSWLVLAFEVVLPIALWFRETRRLALVAAFIFHAALDTVMHLFVFQWAMMAALLAFLTPDDLQWLGRLVERARSRIQNRAKKSQLASVPNSGQA